MEEIFEVVLQFIFELMLQLIFEVFSEMGLHSLDAVFERPVRHPWLASLGYFLLGAAAGGISLLAIRTSLIHHPSARLVNLFLTPVLAGLVMFSIGRWRQKQGRELVRLDRFGYGFLFAFGMALVRFLYATRPPV